MKAQWQNYLREISMNAPWHRYSKEISGWRKIPFDSCRSRAPEINGVYVIIDGKANPIYVGVSSNIHARISSHNRFKQFEECGAKYFLYAPIIGKQHGFEAKIIDVLNPLLNLSRPKVS